MTKKRGPKTVKIMRTRSVLASLSAALVVGACGSDASNEDVVAHVGPYRLMVDQAVALLVDQENLAAEARVVESLAELWVDYTLLAEAAAEDSTFSQLDLEPLVMQQVSQEMVFQLRDSMIQVDTFITEDELRGLYEAEAPAVEVRARHIMLQMPLQATAAQQDSVRGVLAEVRRRVLSGEDFGTLAQEYSQDPGSAFNGGDLGYFGRGDMVAPFEEAVLALEPGEVSEVVTTPMGLHLIRLEDRRVQGFEDLSAQYRRQVQGRMVQEAESVFVSGLFDRVDPVVSEGAYDILREIATTPGARLSGRAERRALIEWDGGSVAVSDVRQLFQLESVQLRTQVAEGSDEELADFLQSLARRELLIRAAEAEGLRPAQDSVNVLVDDARVQLREATRLLGLLRLEAAPGEARDIAISRTVEEALADILSGATQVVPLGMVGFQLRDGRSIAIEESGVGAVIVGVAEIRTARQLSPIEGIAVDSAVARDGGDGR